MSPLGHPVALELTGGGGGRRPAPAGPIARLARRSWRTTPTEPCVPPRENRKAEVAYDRPLYKQRSTVERDFARAEQYRRAATRYDERGRNYLGFVWVASINIMLA